MFAFNVKDMTCGHCVSAITNAVHALDKDAKVQVDLARHRVEIESGKADGGKLREAIEEAGYTPVISEDGAGAVVADAPAARGGCCCR